MTRGEQWRKTSVDGIGRWNWEFWVFGILYSTKRWVFVVDVKHRINWGLVKWREAFYAIREFQWELKGYRSVVRYQLSYTVCSTVRAIDRRTECCGNENAWMEEKIEKWTNLQDVEDWDKRRPRTRVADPKRLRRRWKRRKIIRNFNYNHPLKTYNL